MKRFRTYIRFPHMALLTLSALVPFAFFVLTYQSAGALAPKTFTVNSSADSDDGACDPLGASGRDCTLREAIQRANAHAAADFIFFDIPLCPCTIPVVGSGLPIITDAVTIDGYTQPGSLRNTLPSGDNAILNIQLSGGQSPPGTDGLRVQASNVYVEGLKIDGFSRAGISLMAHPGPTKINGNFIGTTSSNGIGIGVETNSHLNLIGSTNHADRNQIQNNTQGGIIWLATGPGTANDNQITGNYIVANGHTGIQIDHGKRNLIHDNVISGNGFYGISIVGGSSGQNVITANSIGLAVHGGGGMGNNQEGIFIGGGAGQNRIGGPTTDAKNRIAYNRGPGITIGAGSSRRNAIRGNAIYNNGGMGIDLGPLGFDGVTANDPPPDADIGANDYQNFPRLLSAFSSNGQVRGKLASAPNTTYIVEIFSNPSCSFGGLRQGKFLLDTKVVITSSTGRGSFLIREAAFDAGRGITATATDPLGNTSEFSECIRAE